MTAASGQVSVTAILNPNAQLPSYRVEEVSAIRRRPRRNPVNWR
jgi:hypothetical protein